VLVAMYLSPLPLAAKRTIFIEHDNAYAHFDGKVLYLIRRWNFQ
jgi:hypothetical protein